MHRSKDGFQAVYDILKVNAALHELNLRSNRIGDAGAAAIAEALKSNAVPNLLYIDWNKISNAGKDAIRKCITQKTDFDLYV